MLWTGQRSRDLEPRVRKDSLEGRLRSRRHWLAAAIIVLPSLTALLQVARVYVQMPLGRDPMIFQYTAWAAQQGEVLYRDIFDVNGPLITLLHIAFQALGGEQAFGLRCIDLCLRTLVFSIVGLAILDATQRGDATADQPARLSERLAWSLIVLVALLGVYSNFDFWDSLQRDGLYFLWTLSSAALQTHAMGPRGSAARSRSRWMLAAALLSGVPWLGKPSFVAFSIVQAITLTLAFAERERGQASWRVCLTAGARWLIGCSIGALATALVSSSIADMSAWLTLLRHDVLAVYRHLATVDAATQWRSLRGAVALAGIVGAALQIYLVRKRRLPARALFFGWLPLAAIVHIAIQSKGYFYHHEPLWMAVGVQWIVMAAQLWSAEAREHGMQATRIVAALALSALIAISLRGSMYFPLEMLLDARHPAARDPHMLLQLFSQSDSRLLDERLAGDYLAATIAPSDRVQMFGMDPGVLYLARRRSATPYVYAFDLVLDHTLTGARLSGATAAQLQAIERVGAERREDFVARLRARPPAKLVFPASAVFLPGAPEQLFRERMPKAAAWLDASYRLEREVGSLRIYARNAAREDPRVQ